MSNIFFMTEITKEMSKQVLIGAGSDEAGHFLTLIDGAIESNDNALSDKRLRDHLAKGFDVVLVSPFIASEAGYYLAQKTNAALVLYFTAQTSLSPIDWAVGQPHNSAFLPFVLLDFQLPMTFLQRVLNTVATYGFHLVRYNQFVLSMSDRLVVIVRLIPNRNNYFIWRGERLLDKHFPGEERLPLLDIERNTSLVLHYGHPLITDGMRPISPNFQYIGMMNCKEAQPLPKDLADFMESGKEHGVIFVSFGSVLQAKEMTEERRKLLVNVFGSLKQKIGRASGRVRVLWYVL